MGGSVECTTVFTCFITAFPTLSRPVPSFHQLHERLWLAEWIELPAAVFLYTGHRCFGGLKGRGGVGGVELCWAHFIV